MSFDTRKDMIRSIVPPGGTYAEVGVFKGEFTMFLQETLKPAKLYAIDIFEGQTGSGDQDGNNFSFCRLEETYAMLDSKGIVTLKGDSSTTVKTLKDESLDMIYIDADHEYSAVKKDLEASYPKVKKGGWIMGHDYEMNMSKALQAFDCNGLRRAVDEFCAKYQLSIQYLGMDGCVSYAIKK
jgi:predicted O-methyltransferase YrrM